MKNLLQKFVTVVRAKKQPLITASLLSVVMVSYQNCQEKDEYFQMSQVGSAIVVATPPTIEPPVEEAPPEPEAPPLCQNGSTQDLICNPLGGGEPVKTAKSGLLANLYEGKYGFNGLNIYFTDGYKHPETIYFSNFNVTPRSFSDGFSVGENDFLKTQTGTKLIEWFAIEAKGHIRLPDDKEEGFYHIITVSDDGIVVRVDGQDIISNPTNHAPQIDCAKAPLEFKKGEEHDFWLGYYQGPRYQIALQTYIKKVDPATYTKSALCKKANDTQALLNEGYEIIKPDWFTLPEGY